MKMRLLLSALFILVIHSTNLSAQNAPADVDGKWYVLVQWKPIASQKLVACWMLFELNHGVILGIDSTQNKNGTWYVDTLTQRVVAVFGETSYRLIVSDSNMTGTVSNGSSSGYVEATRFKGPYWDSIFAGQSKPKDRAHFRMGVDYYKQDLSVGRLHLGMALNPTGLSFNTEALSLSVLKKDNRTYISSNALWPLASGIGYLMGYLSSKENAEIGAMTPIIAQMLGNFDVNVPLGTPLLCFDFGQQTDFYFFYDVSRVCTASYGGVMLNLYPLNIPLQAVASYQIPWYKGYMTTRENYFSARLNLVF